MQPKPKRKTRSLRGLKRSLDSSTFPSSASMWCACSAASPCASTRSSTPSRCSSSSRLSLSRALSWCPSPGSGSTPTGQPGRMRRRHALYKPERSISSASPTLRAPSYHQSPTSYPYTPYSPSGQFPPSSGTIASSRQTLKS